MASKNCWVVVLALYVFVHNIRQTVSDSSENDVLQQLEVGVANMLAAKEETSGCVVVDGLCLLEEDLSSYDAIKSLHRLLDDDMSGEIDMTESVDFLMEELTITDGYNTRQKNLHHNSDSYISVQDLWHMWKRSEVHNWTVDETVQWMADTVGLPQYTETFLAHGINGSYLPRLTLNKSNYLGSVLGIKGLSHRTKVTVKAMDAVLFGPPKGSRLKDMLIAGLVTVILVGLGYIIYRNHKMMVYHTRLITQIEDLQQEEVKYRAQLQKIKDKASEEASAVQQATASTSDIPDSGVGCDGGSDVGSVSDVSSSGGGGGSRSAAGGAAAGGAARRGHHSPSSHDHEQDYDDEDDECNSSNTGSVTPPPHGGYGGGGHEGGMDRASLVHWLQVTYQKEKLVLESKRRQAQAQIVKATEICNKLRAQGKNPLNLFSLMHGKMDNVEKTISLARAGMQEVQRDEKERQERWGEIERLVDSNIRRYAELHNVMGSYTSLQTNATSPAESSNIDSPCGGTCTPSLLSTTTTNGGGARASGGSSVRSTASSTRSTPYTNNFIHHSASAAAEFQRFDDDSAESVSLPRCSSFGSNTAARLSTSASHQQLADQYTGDSCYGNTRYPPQKKPRRNRPSSGKPLSSANGLVCTGSSGILAEESDSATTTPTSTSAESGGSGRTKAAGFTMGGSPLVLPPGCSLLSERTTAPSPPPPGPTGDDLTNVTKSHGVPSSASDSSMSATSPTLHNSSPTSNSLSSAADHTSPAPQLPSSASSSISPALGHTPSSLHHRSLSQQQFPEDASKLTPSSKSRVRKKNFFERLTGSRKSSNKSNTKS